MILNRPLSPLPAWVLGNTTNAANNPSVPTLPNGPAPKITGGLSEHWPTADFNQILAQCPFISYCKDQAAILTEAEWLAALTIVVRCENGEQLAHEISRPYPGYTFNETQKKIKHAKCNQNPRTCKHIEQHINGAYCKTCMHRNTISSPIVLGGNSAAKTILDQKVEELNKEYAVVWHGGKLFIMREKYDIESKRHVIEFVSSYDFKTYYMNHIVKIPVIGKQAFKEETLGNYWLKSGKRRQFEHITFNPGVSMPGWYNLYKGLTVSPAKGDWSLYRKHMVEVVCNGDQRLFDYLFTWMARIIQDPGGKRPGTAVVLRGKQGTGKSIFVTIFGQLFGEHFLHITGQRQLAGNFNGHLRNSLVVFCDETNWTSDPQAEGILKSMITEDSLMIEAKHKDAIPIRNHANLFVASNNRWVVPAGWDDRRFLVLDVSDHRCRDYEYFKAMIHQMNHGGLEALLFDLQHHDISKINLREAPKTEGLFKQKLESLNTVHRYWYERLATGDLFYRQDNYYSYFNWGSFVPTRMWYEDYVEYTKKILMAKPISDSQFPSEIRKCCRINDKAIQKTLNELGRMRGYEIPSLDECQHSFSNYINTPITWE